MKPIALIFVSLAAAALGVFLAMQLRSNEPSARASAAAPDDVARIARSLEALEKKTNDLSKGLDELRMSGATRDTLGARVPLGDIDAAVARAVGSRGESPAAAPEAKAKKLDAKTAYQQLASFEGTWDERQALWKEITDAGMLDEVVLLFEARAKEQPNDPAAQVDAGKAYLQKVQSASNGPERGLWANKADKSFDAALAIDDRNWEARFQKAVSLSFWPPLFGKQNEAISNFETLIQQQEHQPNQGSFAETHLWLGNLYQQSGKTDKAIAAWQKGLQLFPDNEALKKQIATAQAH